MVKLANNLSHKLEKQPSVDDGFDNVPLITPLEVNQLRHSFAQKVIVKTSAQYELQKKKQQQQQQHCAPGASKLSIKFHSNVSDKAKIVGLILIMLAFLTSLLLLLMCKAMWYDQLTCPEGFVLKQKHCTPAALEMFYTQQQQQQQRPGLSAANSQGLYVALSHLGQVMKEEAELPKPWLPGAKKQSETNNQDLQLGEE